jgi:hypothetical protein
MPDLSASLMPNKKIYRRPHSDSLPKPAIYPPSDHPFGQNRFRSCKLLDYRILALDDVDLNWLYFDLLLLKPLDGRFYI